MTVSGSRLGGAASRAAGTAARSGAADAAARPGAAAVATGTLSATAARQRSVFRLVCISDSSIVCWAVAA
nr:hypothetical protein GCM10020093_040640 [Planobispora longispora]